MLDSAIYNDNDPKWAERAKTCPMTANSFDTLEDVVLSEAIDEGTASEEERAYMAAKYGSGPGGSE